jgi:hypothetical protein
MPPPPAAAGGSTCTSHSQATKRRPRDAPSAQAAPASKARSGRRTSYACPAAPRALPLIALIGGGTGTRPRQRISDGPRPTHQRLLPCAKRSRRHTRRTPLRSASRSCIATETADSCRPAEEGVSHGFERTPAARPEAVTRRLTSGNSDKRRPKSPRSAWMPRPMCNGGIASRSRRSRRGSRGHVSRRGRRCRAAAADVRPAWLG